MRVLYLLGLSDFIPYKTPYSMYLSSINDKMFIVPPKKLSRIEIVNIHPQQMDLSVDVRRNGQREPIVGSKPGRH